jgi:hypothetical protein
MLSGRNPASSQFDGEDSFNASQKISPSDRFVLLFSISCRNSSSSIIGIGEKAVCGQHQFVG